MKKVIFILGFLMFAPLLMMAQSDSQLSVNKKRLNVQNQEERSVSVGPSVKVYAVSDTKTIASYFITGIIPISFPKNDAILSESENVNRMIAWVENLENRKLIKKDALSIIDSKIAEYRSK